ncbi:NfeD family protein [Vibrio mangrovi]|uniref:Nodulation protein NfeD n=1 Tax=Vibrio mangrovi TaxID=474394 RepID=A0A1Y6IYQ7_9VIBR|nr:nodulation protein NfeD [Vibrio mangrovi]MDW6005399.1 nodulation protein NfeD [Vibrio mangrovi]SMS02161.1 hypothetical protein VIM7927_03479 [Vibrio mangrovi]
MYHRVLGIVLGCLIGFTGLSVADVTVPEGSAVVEDHAVSDGNGASSQRVLSETVPVLSISGAIGPAVGDYVTKGIRQANQRPDVSAIIITLDTPGGLSSTLRDINQQILASKIPVLCLVYPQGARAASAGTYILYACHIAAMSPATTLGAATPVNISGPSGEQKDEGGSHEPSAMEKKVLNDSIAYIRSLAQLRGRNVEWAEKAVKDAATLSASEALKLNVVNLVTDDPASLLQALDGQEITVNQQQQTMHFANAVLELHEPDMRNQFLATITDPNIAYILMMIGVYGLLLEFYSPGFGIAGITGAVALLIALYAFQLLPVNYAGLGLMAVGIALLVAESFVPSFGLFGISGIVVFTLGSVFLIDSDLPELSVSLYLIYSIALVSAALVIFVLKNVWKLRKKQVVSGLDSLVGSEIRASESFAAHGFLQVRGERWAAVSDEPVKRGETVVIQAVKGLVLQVGKATGRNGAGPDSNRETEK